MRGGKGMLLLSAGGSRKASIHEDENSSGDPEDNILQSNLQIRAISTSNSRTEGASLFAQNGRGDAPPIFISLPPCQVGCLAYTRF